jgi:hypothetical protein
MTLTPISALTDEQIAALQRSVEVMEALYHELIMQVSQKFPGESRHETAKRYIIERENRNNCSDTAQQALKGGEK